MKIIVCYNDNVKFNLIIISFSKIYVAKMKHLIVSMFDDKLCSAGSCGNTTRQFIICQRARV